MDQTKQRINGVPVSPHGGNTSSKVSSTVRVQTSVWRLHAHSGGDAGDQKIQSKQWSLGWSDSRGPGAPVLNTWRPCQQRRSSDHPTSLRAPGDHSSREEQQSSLAVNNPEVGGGTTNRATMDTPHSIEYKGLKVSVARLTADRWGQQLMAGLTAKSNVTWVSATSCKQEYKIKHSSWTWE